MAISITFSVDGQVVLYMCMAGAVCCIVNVAAGVGMPLTLISVCVISQSIRCFVFILFSCLYILQRVVWMFVNLLIVSKVIQLKVLMKGCRVGLGTFPCLYLRAVIIFDRWAWMECLWSTWMCTSR